MTWGLVAVAGATLAGGVLGSNAASSAADTQAASADKATALQREIFNKQVELNDPYRRMGLGAGNRLMTLLGLSPGASATGLDGTTPDRNALRAQLLSKYTTTVPGAGPQGGSGWNPETGNYDGGGAPTSTVDEAGLNAEIDRQMAGQGGGSAGTAGMGDPNDPAFGSLMKDFSAADFQADPGRQFRVDQGQQGLERSAAARGGLLSGRAMKDAMSFNQGLASQDYADAFNRFQVNRTNKLNPLQSLMGVGQTATGADTGAAGSYGAGASSNIMGAGNARASGIVGGANAINNAIGQGTSMYQTNELMNKLFSRGSGYFPNRGSYSEQ